MLPAGKVSPCQSLVGVRISDQLLLFFSKSEPVPLKNKVAAEYLGQMPAADIKIWIDGSARDGNKDGESGLFICGNTIGNTELISPAGIVVFRD